MNVAISGNRVIADVINYYEVIRVGPDSYDQCLLKNRKDTQTEDFHVTTEAEIEVMDLQAQECHQWSASTGR